MSRAGYEYTLRLAPRIDRVLIPLTRGWFSSLGLNRAGFLVTTGAKSGTTRTNPIVFIRQGDELLAIGSNYGRSVHPSWSANLIAHPECQVHFRGPRATYRAELQTGIDRDRIWETVLDYSVAYARYAEKAAPRQIRVFRLVRKT